MGTVDDYIADLSAFVEASPTSYHVAAELAARLKAHDFRFLHESDDWPAQPGCYLVVRDGAAIAFVIPRNATGTTPFHILGAHTDSPGFKLKPAPTVVNNGWLQAGVEVYGGPLLNSWLDRELCLAGRIVTSDGTTHLVKTGPLLRIPQLAIHLDRSVNDNLSLNPQKHTQPVLASLITAAQHDELGNGSTTAEAPKLADAVAAGLSGDILTILVQAAGFDGGYQGIAADPDPDADGVSRVEPGTIITGFDVLVVETQAPRRFGVGESLLASGRLDNLSSVHAGLVALIAAAERAQEASHVSVLAAFDHEEVGSQSYSGAAGSFLDDVLHRIGDGLQASTSDTLRARSASWLVSADAGHGIHPNYPERHDPANQPRLGGGPLLKINANQRYTTDAAGSALWAGLSARAGTSYQPFVSNNSVPCGSTIGPMAATRLGIRTLDVGIPLLSMHSAREMCHVDDPHALAATLTEFFAA